MTDETGRAWVTLPSYFSDINANFKYQLTVVQDGDTAEFVQVKVAQRISGNRFLIRTNVPKVEVSWRIEADRYDRWVQRYGAPTEVAKSETEDGLYEHPELYGASPERGVNHRVDATTEHSAAKAPKP